MVIRYEEQAQVLLRRAAPGFRILLDHESVLRLRAEEEL